jgi:hypothetical protein
MAHPRAHTGPVPDDPKAWNTTLSQVSAKSPMALAIMHRQACHHCTRNLFSPGQSPCKSRTVALRRPYAARLGQDLSYRRTVSIERSGNLGKDPTLLPALSHRRLLAVRAMGAWPVLHLQHFPLRAQQSVWGIDRLICTAYLTVSGLAHPAALQQVCGLRPVIRARAFTLHSSSLHRACADPRPRRLSAG